MGSDLAVFASTKGCPVKGSDQHRVHPSAVLDASTKGCPVKGSDVCGVGVDDGEGGASTKGCPVKGSD